VDVRGEPYPEMFFFDASVDRDDFPAYSASLGGPTPDVASYSWGGEGGYLLAVQDLSVENPRIRVSSGFSGDAAFHYRIDGQDPDWGPNSYNRMAFRRLVPADGVGTDTWVIETADEYGGRRFTEASVPRPASASTTRSLARPKFSPDGSHIAYQLERNGTGTTNYILRETGGLGPKDLTPGLKPAAAGETGLVLVDWR
jgi:hypothetical protein